ncbi:MAG: bifunctional heptose 7-phosphate kinase/heptose 1-phosphate adenyltransferase [Planctomycetota bacterium]|nr:bifunctional heptose 7-phosphate kinase/heptose 1-phosphate adenyltransferase [Planctomycetota bacterium]
MSTLLEHLSRWKPFTALVVGDFMLDEQVTGDAERLSPDAPVPILRVRSRSSNPGGAANVCLDLAALKGRVLAFGVVGDDAPGHTLRAALQARGIDATGVITDSSRPTTLKQSLVGLAQGRHPQKMFRVDEESREPLARGQVDRLLAAFQVALPSCDVVCIEDYAKGVVSPELSRGVIEASRRAGKPVFVDPARLDDYSRYRGASVLTPNRSEAEQASGLLTSEGPSDEHNASLARALLEATQAEAIVLTLDKQGALLLERGRPPVSAPTVARQVYDVTGAGDVFLAALAAGRANEMSWIDATRLANAAAGLEVEVFGVQPIPLERVHHSLLMLESQSVGKLRTLDQLLVEVASRRSAGQSIVFTNGCFDVLHAGHVSLLDRAAREGDFLIVAINDDASVARLKGPGRPINPAGDRARVLGALGSVGAVVFFGKDRAGHDTPTDLIEAVRPDVLVKGGDYTRDRVVGAEIVERSGGRVVLVDVVPGRSSTATIERIKSQGG